MIHFCYVVKPPNRQNVDVTGQDQPCDVRSTALTLAGLDAKQTLPSIGYVT